MHSDTSLKVHDLQLITERILQTLQECEKNERERERKRGKVGHLSLENNVTLY